jgi:WD40 repeat protein
MLAPFRPVSLAWALILLLGQPARGDPKPQAVAVDRNGDALPAGAIARLGTHRFRHGYGANSIAFAADGKTIATAGSGAIRFWDVQTGLERRQYQAPDIVRSIDFSADGKTLIVLGQFRPPAYLIDVESGKLRHTFGEKPMGREAITVDDSNEVRALALLPDGKTLAVPFQTYQTTSLPDGISHHDPRSMFRLWEIQSGKNVGEVAIRKTWDRYTFITFAPDGKAFACSGKENDIELWDRKSDKPLRCLAGHTDSPLCAAFSTDGKVLASGGKDGIVRLWDPESGKELRRLTEKTKSVRSVLFTPDGKQLLSVGRDRIDVWDWKEGKRLRQLETRGRDLVSMAISRDGKQVAAVGHRGIASLWELETGKPLCTFDGHQGSVESLAFRPDGKALVSAGDDAVLLWDDPASAKTPARVVGAGADCVAFFPDGKRIATGHWKAAPEIRGAAVVWPPDSVAMQHETAHGGGRRGPQVFEAAPFLIALPIA